MYDLQKASMFKRISAYLFDVILLSIVAVLCMLALSAVLGYDGYSETVDAAYDKYGEITVWIFESQRANMKSLMRKQERTRKRRLMRLTPIRKVAKRLT